MRNKILKKTAASIMALAFLSGAAPVGLNALQQPDTAITANADSPTYKCEYDEASKTYTFSGTMPADRYGITELYAISTNKAEHIVFAEKTVLPKDCSYLFSGYSSLKTVDFTKADLSKVENAAGMFEKCTSLEKVTFTGTDLSAVTSLSEMFIQCVKLTDVIDLSASSSKLTKINSLFEKCYKLPGVDLNKLNTKNVTDFSSLFASCYNLRTADLSGFDTSSATDMNNMFFDCYSLVSVDTSPFDTRNVTNMSCLFDNCEALSKLDLSNFDTSNCTDFSYMFSCCHNLREIDISSFTISDNASLSSMMSSDALRKIKLGDNVKGITEKWCLNPAPYGWVNEKDTSTVVSDMNVTNGTAFENNGVNTYIKNPNKGTLNGIGININSDGTFTMKVTVDLPDTLTEEEKASASLYCTPRNLGRSENLPLKSDGKGGYYAEYRVLAKEMATKMFFRLMINDVYVDNACCSIRQYADTLLADPEKYSKEEELIKSMLVFGGAAQRQFNYNIESIYYPEADRGISYSKTVINSADKFTAPTDLAQLSYYGSSIVLGSGIVQRHYFELAGGDINDYTFEVDGVKTTSTLKSETSSLYYVDAVKNASAKKLYDASSIKVYKTSEPAKTMEFDYSVMDYVRLAKNNGAEGTAFDVIKTLSWLADEAKAYFENK